MIRAHFGIDRNPFANDASELLPHQQLILETLRVHCQQGGFCLVMGNPGTGKSVVRETLVKGADKRLMVASVTRTMHTYSNTVRILAQAFGLDHGGNNFKSEKRPIEGAHTLKQYGRAIVTVIDNDHLLDIDTLRGLRLLLGDFPRNHNLVLFGQPELLSNLQLRAHDDIKSRITYSVCVLKLGPDDMEAFLLAQLDLTGLPHPTFSPETLWLVVRATDGILKRARNLAPGRLLEAVRARKRVVDLENVNRVLLQPHWREDRDLDKI